MKIACLMIMALLATAVVHAESTTVHDAVNSIPPSLGRGLSGLLVRRDGTQTLAGRKVAGSGTSAVQTTGMRAKAGVQEGGQRVEKMGGVCMTHEQCHKKKVVCSKKCTESHGAVEKNDVPKCTVVCKKCVPC